MIEPTRTDAWEAVPQHPLTRARVLESSCGTRDDQALAIGALLTEEVTA